ncbi:3-oxoacyl-ACP synthase III family protein [Streptomyces sp. NPDC057743]|uniref:3-oxoacyl-ACP synthase III family protein n=1 Tax=Streptomyces sp. NPDC057743 TaxID=3346236 RepID=UPI00369CE955
MSLAATLERIDSFVPEKEVKIEQVAESLGLRRPEVGVFRKIYGLDRLRFDPDLNLFDLVLPAARKALSALPEGGRVSQVIFAHTTPTLTPPHLEPAQIIRDRLGLYDAEAFALNQQACVSSLGALDLAAELLRAEGEPGSHALMVTGERAFSPKVQLIPDTAIMADAASACLLTLGGAGDTVESFVTRTRGEFSEGLLQGKEQTQRFGQLYAPLLAEVMREAAAGAGLDFDDIDLVIPHNVNAISWRNTIKEMGADPARFFLDNVPEFSHCFASDVFLNYTTLRDAGRLVDGGRYLLVSVGLGATFGAMVLTHRKR